MNSKNLTKADKEHESKGMKHRKEAHAGHKYNESKKHHEAEARGMKKAMHKKACSR